jgi:hypothetical protein
MLEQIWRRDTALGWGLLLLVCAGLAACATGDGSTAPVDPAAGSAPVVRISATPEGALQSLFLTAAAQPTSQPAASATPIPMIARYQAFEHGFLLQRGGEACVYAYTTFATSASLDDGIVIPAALAEQAGAQFRYCIALETLNEGPPVDPTPPGLLLPDGVFLQVWAAYPELRQALGYATAEAFYHAAFMPPTAPETGYAPVAPLPDGRALYCGTQPLTAGTCTVR